MSDSAAPAIGELAIESVEAVWPPGQLIPDEVDLVLYHGGCMDGFTAAYCAWAYFASGRAPHSPGRAGKVVYRACYHDRPPPLAEAAGKGVLICDFAWKAPAMQDLIAVARQVLVLDHHKSAEADLRGVPDSMKRFDMGRSGARLAFEYFNPGAPVPRLVAYVEDHDLWRKALPGGDAFTAWLQDLPFEFGEYARLESDEFLDRVVFPQGAAIARHSEAAAARMAKKASTKFLLIGGRHYIAAHLNASTLRSELGALIIDRFPGVDFSVVYSVNDRDDSTSFSLRSHDGASDVSAIAEMYGGGGHRNAAGCRVRSVASTLPPGAVSGSEAYESLSEATFGRARVGGDIVRVVYFRAEKRMQRALGMYLLQPRHAGAEHSAPQEATCLHDRLGAATAPAGMYRAVAAVGWCGEYEHDRISFTVVTISTDIVADMVAALIETGSESVEVGGSRDVSGYRPCYAGPRLPLQ